MPNDRSSPIPGGGIEYDAPNQARASFDPLRYCVMTTVALLSWLVGPAVMVVVMSAIGLWAYGTALRAGLTRTRCLLRSPRLTLLYLGVACVAGVTALAARLLGP